MSTDYRPLKDILFDEVFDGRLEKYGIAKVLPDNLIGRDGVLVVYRGRDGTCTFRRNGFTAVPYAV